MASTVSVSDHTGHMEPSDGPEASDQGAADSAASGPTAAPVPDPPPTPGESGISRRQGIALGVATALTLAGAGYSLSTLDGRQALATRSAPSSASASRTSSASSSPSSAPSASGPVAGRSSAPAASATPSASPIAGPNGVLAPPAPWERISDAEAKTGPVNLARAVQIDGHGALSRTGLQQLGFASGVSRAWQAGGAALLILDYTFRDAKGAAGFVSYGRRARDADTGFRRQPVNGIPGAVAYRTTGTGPGTRVVLFSHGRSAFIVGVQGTPPVGAAGDVGELARRQYQVTRG